MHIYTLVNIRIPLINTDSDSTQPGTSLGSNRKLTDDMTGNHSTYIHIRIDIFCYPLAMYLYVNK